MLACDLSSPDLANNSLLLSCFVRPFLLLIGIDSIKYYFQLKNFQQKKCQKSNLRQQFLVYHINKLCQRQAERDVKS